MITTLIASNAGKERKITILARRIDFLLQTEIIQSEVLGERALSITGKLLDQRDCNCDRFSIRIQGVLASRAVLFRYHKRRIERFLFIVIGEVALER
jgi:hypothetical protein